MLRILTLVCLVTMTFAVQPASQPAQSAAEQLMLNVAKDYSQWGRVDAEARWAPYLCRAPLAGTHRFSESDDPGTHGQKIYALYAMHRDAYIALNDALPKDAGGGFFPVGLTALPDTCDQVIVKESFVPEEVKPGDRIDYDFRLAVRDGKAYRAGEKRDLFIMAHVKPSAGLPADQLDDGWLYATITPDRKTVSQVGRIASCVKCHVDAPHGRLFGLARDK